MRCRQIILSLALAVAAVSTATAADTDQTNPFTLTTPTRLPYDKEYPVLRYGSTPTHNAIAQLQQRLQ